MKENERLIEGNMPDLFNDDPMLVSPHLYKGLRPRNVPQVLFDISEQWRKRTTMRRIRRDGKK